MSYPSSLTMPVASVQIGSSFKPCSQPHPAGSSIASCSGAWTGSAVRGYTRRYSTCNGSRHTESGYRSFTEQYLDSCGLFKDAVISILATIAKQERVRLSERTIAGLQRARQQGRIGGRPRKECDREKLAELRRSGLSLAQIATQTGLSKTTVARMVTA